MEGGIVLENHGIGYEIHMPSSSAVFLAGPEDNVIVYTFLAVREDDVSLYGFDRKDELEMFLLLTSVSGIGNKAALSILSVLSVQEVKKAILFEDPNAFVRAPGIGKKSASRIILELKDKIRDTSVEMETGSRTPSRQSGVVSSFEDAISALIALGYTRGEASEAVSSVHLEDASAEELIRGALRALSGI